MHAHDVTGAVRAIADSQPTEKICTLGVRTDAWTESDRHGQRRAVGIIRWWGALLRKPVGGVGACRQVTRRTMVSRSVVILAARSCRSTQGSTSAPQRANALRMSNNQQSQRKSILDIKFLSSVTINKGDTIVRNTHVVNPINPHKDIIAVLYPDPWVNFNNLSWLAQVLSRGYMI